MKTPMAQIIYEHTDVASFKRTPMSQSEENTDVTRCCKIFKRIWMSQIIVRAPMT